MEEINSAIEIGKMVREKPKEHMEAQIKSILKESLKGNSCCSSDG